MKNLIITITLLTLTFSCKKEGCNDIDAVNFNSLATKDNGTCTYESSVTFWWSQTTYNWLYNANYSDEVIIFIDNEIVLSQGVYGLFWTTEPNCESNGLLRFDLKLGSEKSLTKEYKVTDESGSILWSGNITFEANKCTSFELKN